MEHFRYIDTVRDIYGRIRPWEQHDLLAKYENTLKLAKIAYLFKDMEYEERERIQNSISQMRKAAERV